MKAKKIENPQAFFGRDPEGGVSDRTAGSNRVGCVNWPTRFPYSPAVSFDIAHTGNTICLKFYVDEKAVMAKVADDNGPVWTDSCVEFFISFDNAGYYNFEFNCIGTALLGFRKEREKYEHAGTDIMKLIRRESTLGSDTFDERTAQKHWELSVEIPVEAFFKHRIGSLSGMKARANFYKCGDGLSDPHFLSWSPIETPNPDFHVERFFGELQFER